MPAFYNAPDGQQAQGVIIVNATSSPIPTAPTVAMGGGPIDANTQRVTLAADGPGVAAALYQHIENTRADLRRQLQPAGDGTAPA